VCALRRSTGFPLDALTFVVCHFLPHLIRDAVYRILKAEGLNRLPPSQQARKPHSTFKEYEVGFIHVDIKQWMASISGSSCLHNGVDVQSAMHRLRLPNVPHPNHVPQPDS
jgi:hypothetical protein